MAFQRVDKRLHEYELEAFQLAKRDAAGTPAEIRASDPASSRREAPNIAGLWHWSVKSFLVPDRINTIKADGSCLMDSGTSCIWDYDEAGGRKITVRFSDSWTHVMRLAEDGRTMTGKDDWGTTVTHQVVRQVFRLDQQVDTLGLDSLRQDGTDIDHQTADGNRGFLQGELASLDFRDVEDKLKKTPRLGYPICANNTFRSRIGIDRPNFRLTLAILAKFEVANSTLII